jgi:hypothetical protein
MVIAVQTIDDVSVLRLRQAEFAERFHLTIDEFLYITRSCSTEEIVSVLELMKTVNHRSSFRRSCALRVRRWLDNRNGGKPLSVDQFKAVVPTWPIAWRLPT